MPNHVVNKVILIGEKSELEAIVNAVRGSGEEQYFDFNKINPMPEILHTVTSPVKILTEKGIAKEKLEQEKAIKQNPQRAEFLSHTHSITKQMQKEYLKKYGADNWYDWACNNWGTKWNCYDQIPPEFGKEPDGRDNVTFIFSTAWSCPHPLIENLSMKYPNVIVRVRWSDEDVSYNIGVVRYLNGKILDQSIPAGGSKEAYELYFEMHPESREYYRLEGNEYVYDEDAEESAYQESKDKE